jgi:hypothetical protein
MSRRRNTSRGGPLEPLRVFPSALAAAEFIRSSNTGNYHYPLDRIQFRVGNGNQSPNMFPSRTGEFSSLDEVKQLLWQVASQGQQGMVGPEPSAATGPHNAFMRQQAMRAEREAQHQQKREEGWRFIDGSWIKAEVGPLPSPPNWESRGLPASATARYSGNQILEEIDRDSLEFLRQTLIAGTSGNSSIFRDRSINPSTALSTIKILLRQNGNKQFMERKVQTYPSRLIDLKILEAQQLRTEKNRWERQWEDSARSNDRFKDLYLYAAQQERDTRLIIDQTKGTQLYLFTFHEVDSQIKDLARQIQSSHEYIKQREEQLGGPLSHKDRLEECILYGGVNILSLSNKIMQIAIMIAGIDRSDLHSDSTSQNVIIEEMYNSLAILKLYSLLDIYGGEEPHGQMCALVAIDQHDDFLNRLARSSRSYRPIIYQGRLFQHSASGIPVELLKRSIFSFKMGVSRAVKLAKDVKTKGLSATIRDETGMLFGRVASSFMNVLHSFVPEQEFNSELSEELYGIEQKAEAMAPLSIEDVRRVSEATTQSSPRLIHRELVQLQRDVDGALDQASQIVVHLDNGTQVSLDELLRSPVPLSPSAESSARSRSIAHEDEPLRPASIKSVISGGSDTGINDCQDFTATPERNEMLLQRQHAAIQAFLIRGAVVPAVQRFGPRVTLYQEQPFDETMLNEEYNYDREGLTPRGSFNNNVMGALNAYMEKGNKP